MINKLLMWITGFLPARAIDIDNKYYIERYHVLKFWKITVMIHRYLGCDGDREVHDHPWRTCIGIPLRGGYREERVIGFCPVVGWVSKLVTIRPWRWNLITSTRFHRIDYVFPKTWTLFITYDRFKSWSFAKRGPDSTVILHQPYDTAAVSGWQERAPKGNLFRFIRGTDND